ncbi:MAG: glycosyltransferase [Casimicrobiaceae bacterium]
MPEAGHFRRLRPLIHGLSTRGVAVHVFTHGKFASEVVRAQGIFHDMFASYPLEEADEASFPVPCRFVTYAARFAEEVARDVAALKPSLIIHDLFTVIGRVVANRLGVPRVNVCSGHNVAPARFLALLQKDPRVRLAPECLRAVDVLRDSYGIADASPFCYVSSISPLLNIYCEPPEFLDESERQPFAPLAFFGSIPAPEDMPSRSDGRSAPRRDDATRPRTVYIAFGTVIWRSWQADALKALGVMATALARAGNVRTVIGLGGASIDPEAIAALTGTGASVESYVDQWRTLQEADVFITHHGLNSTHEAIFHGTPMISYPFFWDQPALAAKCQGFGLAVPLIDTPRGPVRADDVDAAMHAVAARQDAMGAALARARGWELAVIERRPAVLQQLIDLMR